MKTKTLVCGVVFLVVVLAGVCSFAADKEKFGFYVPSPNEEIYGTWVNPEYTETNLLFPPKFVYYWWGGIEGYSKVIDKDPAWKGTATLVDKWTDSEGNTWYKNYERWAGPDAYNGFFLDKISEDGTVLEMIFKSLKWPSETEWDPNNPNRHIYYRQ